MPERRSLTPLSAKQDQQLAGGEDGLATFRGWERDSQSDSQGCSRWALEQEMTVWYSHLPRFKSQDSFFCCWANVKQIYISVIFWKKGLVQLTHHCNDFWVSVMNHNRPCLCLQSASWKHHFNIVPLSNLNSLADRLICTKIEERSLSL